MSIRSRFRVVEFAAAVSLSLFLGGCSGGKGAQAGALTDPASSYKGATTQASVSSTNAEALALGGFGGDKVGSVMEPVALAAKRAAAVKENAPIRRFVQAIKSSTRRMAIPRKAALLRKPEQIERGAAKAKASRKTKFEIAGDNGGVASYSLDINDSAGSFFGTVEYQDFTSQGNIINGNADILGTLDANRQEISRLTLSFKTLTLQAGNTAVDLVGTLSWNFNSSASTEILSINMVQIERASAKTYWFNNYEQTTTYGSNSLTQSVSGRYYDHDHGYVDLSTKAPLVAYYGKSWPLQGALDFSGKLNSWVRLNFSENSLKIEAETNGDGTVDWQVEEPVDNDQPPANRPPMAEAGPDQNVVQFTTVHLDGSASSDPDGDPLTYSWAFVSLPGATYPALTGSNTATPSFVADSAGTYVLRLTVYDGQSISQQDTVKVVVTPVLPSDVSFVKQQWQYGTFGASIGEAGLLTCDLDGDGKPEIIAAAASGGFGDNVLWYVVRHTDDGKYEQIWRSPNYGVTIVRIALADVTGDGKNDVIVALSDGTIHIYDGPTLTEVQSFTVAGPLSDMAVGDLDGDGMKEIITSNGTGISAISAQTGTQKLSVAIGCNSIAVGNVDADPALEIVATSYGGKGYVIDGTSGVVKWEYVNGFGAKVALGDLDGDGMQEIVGSSAWYKITIFDADQKSPAWEISTSLDIAVVTVVDTDGDGVPEIVYGDGQWGKVHAIDVQSQKERWSVNNPEHGVSGIAVGDVDQDGAREILWGAGGTSTGPDFLYIADPTTGTIKWQNQDIYGLTPLAVGDVDDDGEDEIVMVSRESNSGYGEGVIHIFNARTHSLEYQAKLGITDWMGVNSVKIGDVDGDGRTEFVVTTADIYDAVIRVYDGATHVLKKQSAGYYGNSFSALAIGDVDGDGKVEIVAGQGGYLIVFDGATLQEKWKSVDLGSSWGGVYDIKLADLNRDGHQDIIASLGGSRLIVFDGVTHTLKLMKDHPAKALEVADIDGDGAFEILAGRNDGKIDVFDGITFALKKTVSTFSTDSVDALRVADITGSGSLQWLIGGGGRLSILDGDSLKWRSADLSGNVGLYNHISVKDVDGNGRKNIFVGSDLAIYQFE